MMSGTSSAEGLADTTVNHIRSLNVTVAKIRRQLEELPIETAWLSGSLVEELANAGSDIDVYVVLPESSTVEDFASVLPAQLATYGKSGSAELDVRSLDETLELARKVAAAPGAGTSRFALNYLREPEVEFIHRLRVGTPLVHPQRFQVFRRKFDFDAFQSCLIAHQTACVDAAFDDTVGLTEGGHFRSAGLRARYTVEQTMQLLLFAHGVTNHKEKHRERLLSRVASGNDCVKRLQERAWHLYTGLPMEEDELVPYVHRALRFSEEVVGAVQHF